MGFEIRFTVEGPPRTKERARSVKGRHYTPKETVDYQRRIACEAIRAGVPSEPLGGAFVLRVIAYVKREPSSDPRDWDNVGKIVSDALSKLIWKDDRQVVLGIVIKRPTEHDDAEERLVVRARSLEGSP